MNTYYLEQTGLPKENIKMTDNLIYKSICWGLLKHAL